MSLKKSEVSWEIFVSYWIGWCILIAPFICPAHMTLPAGEILPGTVAWWYKTILICIYDAEPRIANISTLGACTIDAMPLGLLTKPHGPHPRTATALNRSHAPYLITWFMNKLVGASTHETIRCLDNFICAYWMHDLTHGFITCLMLVVTIRKMIKDALWHFSGDLSNQSGCTS